MTKIESRWGHQDYIKVEWNLGKRCNYDCGYCPEAIHDNFSPHTDIKILKRTVDKLSALSKPVRLSLTGGEPCVHPHIEQLIQYVKQQHIWLSITTNGTRKHEWYTMQNVDQYVFSLHFEYDWINILNTIKIVNEKVCETQILVNVMAHQDKMKDVRTAVELLDFHKIPYVIRRVRWTEGDHDLFDDMRYEQKDLDWILEHIATVKPNCIIHVDGGTKERHANDIIKLHLNQFKDWKCNIGLESLMINWDGDVHRATCRVGGSLGNIYNGTFTIPTEPIICDRNFCTCAADIPITKEKI
jgi:MoaA/NifB/PqqE/SkfB family radical SAM enzyme